MYKVILIILILITSLSASVISKNSNLSEFNNYKFETPNGRIMKVPKSTKLLIIAFEKDTGRLVNEFLKTKDPFFLLKKNIVYIADIHNMPSIITIMFALPKLKEYKHLIYLHYDDKFEQNVPNKEEMITLVFIEDGVVKNIEFISTSDELEEMLRK